ncbi:zinc finger protein 28-like [Anopheles nili]|uniref:zinc finger protein 28-like n=1 Tax=Anopheles nili TaxID=185578 RepID=UPI00237BB303|nr:zinc finger protein 28-like [Anopheles nili]
MAKTLREISGICRFCLCEDEELLFLGSTVVGISISFEDVEVFTGIRIQKDENISYVICGDCKNKLRKFIAFRRSCLRNDRLYKQLFSELLASTSSECHENTSVHLELHEAQPEDEIILQDEIITESIEYDKNDAAIFNDDITIKDENYVLSPERYDPDELPESHDEPHEKSHPNSAESGSSKKSNFPITEYTSKTTTMSRASNTQSSNKKQDNDASYQSLSAYPPKQLCSICGQMVNYLKRHLLSHTKDAKYACPHCSIKMTDSSNLLRHIAAVHFKTIVKSCEICNKGFTHYNTYHSHMRSQHGIGEVYECKVCSKKFNHPGGVREHFKRLHSNESKFECTLCGKRFKIKRQLKIHERVHSTNQPYACNLCPKRFKSGYARNTHQLTHSGIVFSCKLCDKSYRYKALLNMHLRKFHPEEDEEKTD